MKKIALIILTVILNISTFSCTPDSVSEIGELTDVQACCGDDEHFPPPPPPPPSDD